MRIKCPACKLYWEYNNFDDEIICYHCKNIINLNKKYKVYLIRSVNSFDTKFKYTNYIYNEYGSLIDFIDPLFIGDDNIEYNINECDFIVIYNNNLNLIDVIPELYYAFSLNKPILIISSVMRNHNFFNKNKILFFNSINDCFDFIIEKLINENMET